MDARLALRGGWGAAPSCSFRLRLLREKLRSHGRDKSLGLLDRPLRLVQRRRFARIIGELADFLHTVEGSSEGRIYLPGLHQLFAKFQDQAVMSLDGRGRRQVPARNQSGMCRVENGIIGAITSPFGSLFVQKQARL